MSNIPPRAVTKVTLVSETGDALESVRRAVAFADAMIAEGAEVAVTGDLSYTIRFPASPSTGGEEKSLSAPAGERI